MATKKILIGGSITTLIALFIALQLLGIQITSDGDHYCSDKCESIITVTNPTSNTVSVYNLNGSYIKFSPEIKSFELYKQSNTKAGWTKVNVSKASKSALFAFKPYSNTKIKLVGYKEPKQTIRWSLNISGAQLE